MKSRILIGLLALVLVSCARAAGEDADVSEQAFDSLDEEPAPGEELPPDEGAVDVAGRALDLTDAARAQPGDTVFVGAIGAVVPAAGESVTIVVELEDGSSQTLQVDNLEGGVRARTIEPEDEADGVLDGSPSACRDRAFSRLGHRWSRAYEWRFRSGSTPSTNAASGVARSLKAAAANVARSRNDCGVGAARTPGERYLGRTRRGPNVVGTSGALRCGRPDGRSVVGFGVLPAGVLGAACTWTSGGVASEGDVKLNDRHARWFSGGTPSGCQRAYSVEGTMTHEFGHVFGLGHVAEGSHGNLTMSTHGAPCTVRDASLGRGDVLGLRAVYGP